MTKLLMNRFLLSLLIILFSLNLNAQTEQEVSPSIEKNMFGVQIAVLGVYAHYERGLNEEFSLRAEAGLYPYINSTLFLSEVEDVFFMIPTLRLEPRWYYNLDKRLNKEKRIENNSGNFLSLDINYFPNWFVVFNNSDNDINITEQLIMIVPTWGMRRVYGKHFTLEAGAGLGYGALFDTDGRQLSSDRRSNVVPKLYFRLGYTF